MPGRRVVGVFEATWYPGNRYSEFAVDFENLVSASSAEIYVAPGTEFTFLAGFSYKIPTSNLRLAESYKE